MNKRASDILEYNKIIEMLSGEACSQMARDRILRFSPRSDPREIRDLLEETSEAAEVIVRKGPLPLGGLYDTKPLLLRAKKGGALTMKELLMILRNLKITEDCRNFLGKDLPELPSISGRAEVLEVFPALKDRIDRSILSEDEMADSASPELARIRRDILKENEQIRAKLNSVIFSRTNQPYLQDAIITVRDGRFVVPVKAEHRGKVPGIVHDQSGSGSTLFIEPQAVVEANNRLRELELRERAEIERILLELSGNVAEHFKELSNNQTILTDLDIIFAKGKLSSLMKAEEPKIDEDGYLDLKQARHPLIDRKKVVPINVRLGKDFTTLVVTGPNTGGKTVTLKTMGLLSMMALTGLHIPASAESRVPVYKEIFCDIGDEQSIEQSLSTFSSHMRNTVEFLDKAGLGSLVLLDELGAGTDPTEGAALAISILESLMEKGADVAATTHYNELKKFAISREGVQNASMEFDVETLSPTYRLIIGTPGKSNAFEISKKLGLDQTIIDRADRLIERGDMEFEDVLSKIENDRKTAENERLEAEKALKDAKETEARIQRRLELLDKHENEVLEKARAKARDIVDDANRTVEEVREELRELAKEESLGERNKRLDSGRKKLKDVRSKYSSVEIKEVNNNPVSVNELKPGDRVKLISVGEIAEVLEIPQGDGPILVQAGLMKMRVSPDDLMLVQGGPKGVNVPKKSIYERRTGSGGSTSDIYRTKSMSVSASVNVIGKNLDDAVEDVMKYLDDAYVAGLKEVTVIHGRGQGILQNGLRNLFKTMPTVASYRKGNYNEGGDGVTVVKFREQ